MSDGALSSSDEEPQVEDGERKASSASASSSPAKEDGRSSTSSSSHRPPSDYRSLSSSPPAAERKAEASGEKLNVQSVSSESDDGEIKADGSGASTPNSSAAPKNGDQTEEKPKEDREEGELEEGELETDSEDEAVIAELTAKAAERPRITALADVDRSSPYASTSAAPAAMAIGVCKFFQRGACTWGDTCKYQHTNRGNRGGVWQERRTYGPNGRAKVISSSFVFPTAAPVPLLSVNTSAPLSAEEAWEKAVRDGRNRTSKRDSERDSDSTRKANGSPHKSRRRRHSSSGSSRSRSPAPATAKIPSLLDLPTNKPARRSVTPPRRKEKKDLGPQVVRHAYRSSHHHRSSRSRSRSPGDRRRDSRHHKRRSSPSPRRSPHAKRRSSTSESRGTSTNKHPSSADLTNFRIPKRRCTSRSRSTSLSPVGFRGKNPTRRQIDRFFEERDEDKPAAYRRAKGAKRATSSSSTSSSASSRTSSAASRSSSSSSTSSATSAKDRRKRASKRPKAQTAHAGIEVQAVSSDDEADAKPRKPAVELVPQRVSSSR
ncbi:hypothetical protein M3Y99_01658600 [Aphelenchoides fujianensis]|nr:hypothetical protein M3Y99_01658600 [Aphelenchoides fujianensis]